MPRCRRRHELLFAFLRSHESIVHRDGARNVRDVLLLQRAVQGRRALRRRRRRAPARARELWCAARARSSHGRSQVGVPLSECVIVRRADDRVGSCVRRRWRRQHHGVRVEDRQEPVALPARLSVPARPAERPTWSTAGSTSSFRQAARSRRSRCRRTAVSPQRRETQSFAGVLDLRSEPASLCAFATLRWNHATHKRRDKGSGP